MKQLRGKKHWWSVGKAKNGSKKYRQMAEVLNAMPHDFQTSQLTGWDSVAGNNFNYQFRVYADSNDVVAQAEFDAFCKKFWQELDKL
jgi:hypothetical protein